MVKVCASGMKWQDNLDKKPWSPSLLQGGWAMNPPPFILNQGACWERGGGGGGGGRLTIDH